MPIQFKQRVTYFDMSGEVTTTIDLVSREDLQTQGITPDSDYSFGEELRRGVTEITFPNRFSEKPIRIPVDVIQREFAGVDFDNAYVHLENRFQPDQQRRPSQMLDYFKKMGYSEQQIQELLEREKHAGGRDTA